MIRRSLILGAALLLAIHLPLRGGEVLAEPRKPPALTRKHLKGVWKTALDLRDRKMGIVTNDEIRTAVNAYLEGLGVSLPATFQNRPEGESKTYEVTLNGFVETRRDDRCRELRMSVSSPRFDHAIEPVLLNIDCPET